MATASMLFSVVTILRPSGWVRLGAGCRMLPLRGLSAALKIPKPDHPD
ncbi:hypothetical protein AA0312_0698 [Acetobacter tropicalis NRIC 0312]|uniref:Uncharacterized protein n=1 Tax=Acetobacter tropicalis TaxID=104102 RepID=A0A511FPG1_9PROT|nr:hypothetical protein ATR1_070d0040 [Acetobacter tropicalis]GBR67994.1 hypothetical protein AA0312_0698 [Acetobacter tropicalis NRIC 0312]GEL50841.1 hypothetical protein ATR01nite_19160 [Acetobacter tropicalis]